VKAEGPKWRPVAGQLEAIGEKPRRTPGDDDDDGQFTSKLVKSAKRAGNARAAVRSTTIGAMVRRSRSRVPRVEDLCEKFESERFGYQSANPLTLRVNADDVRAGTAFETVSTPTNYPAFHTVDHERIVCEASGESANLLSTPYRHPGKSQPLSDCLRFDGEDNHQSRSTSSTCVPDPSASSHLTMPIPAPRSKDPHCDADACAFSGRLQAGMTIR